MAEPLWGALQKAQDDDQTIAEAIEAAILAHEEDPTAHLGDGESLSEHKHETVIDHPAGSIVPDKYSYEQAAYRPLFEALTPYTVSGSPVAALPNGVLLGSSGTPYTAVKRIHAPLQSSGFSAGFGIDSLLQCTAYISVFTNVTAWILQGQPPDDEDNWRMGFKLSGGNFYAHLGYYDENYDYQETEVQITGISAGTSYALRVHNDPALETIYFFVDGVQRASIPYPSDPAPDGTSTGFGFQISRSTSGLGYLSCGNVLVGGPGF
jgi:hypothetical protein